jgi:hypothetical protein
VKPQCSNPIAALGSETSDSTPKCHASFL